MQQAIGRMGRGAEALRATVLSAESTFHRILSGGLLAFLSGLL
jgi:predicted RNA-binding protein YlqC (UPF0109 family)